MSLHTAGHQLGDYTVQTPIYEGPLDLLLDLIERTELDITSLALAQVTDQYLEYIHHMQELDAEEISAFLVIAAKLLQIKSEALLPRPPVREVGEEDPGEALARQLQLYKKFKEVANQLMEREIQNLRTYLRLAPMPKIESKLDLSDITLADLMDAAAAAMAQEHEKKSLGTVITAPKVTIREKIVYIAEKLSRSEHAQFSQLLGQHPTRLEVVVTFLALLELVKRYRVSARQDSLFSEIEIDRMAEWDTEEEIDIEFE